MIRILIKGILPNLNDYINLCRTNKYKAASMKSAIETKLGHEIKSQVKESLEKSYRIKFVWKERNKMRDPDNIAFAKKFILDSMVKSKILTNDGWEQIKGFEDEFEVNKSNPGVEIYIEEL